MKKYFFILFICSFLNSEILISQNWQGLGSGTDRYITSLYVDTTTNLLYIGGAFITIDGIPARGIATWDGIHLDTLQAGLDKDQASFPGDVRSIVSYNNKIIVGGDFGMAGNIHSPFIAVWNGINWDSMPARFNSAISDLIVHQGNLYACGAFSTIGTDTFNSIAKFDGTNWTAVGDNYTWNTGVILCMCFYKNQLYVGGTFTDDAKGINRIARWNGTSWEGLPGGIYGTLAGAVDMKVYKNELYVSGLFLQSDGNMGNSIMKWDSLAWSDPGGGMGGINPQVEFMDVHNNYLYASGIYTTAGGILANCIARWDDTLWCSLGSTFDNRLLSTAFYKDTLYVGGGFWRIDGDSIEGIAKWLRGDFVESCGTLTGINETNNSNRGMIIYPNPATDQITIEFDASDSRSIRPAFVEIKNVLGQTMYWEVLKDISGKQSKSIDLSTFSNGIYFIFVKNEKGITNQKFVKE